MKTSRTLGLAAIIAFVISFFLPAYAGNSGFASFGLCWETFLGHYGDFTIGSCLYYGGFIIANVLFVGLAVGLLLTKRFRKFISLLSVVCFLQVLSFLVLCAIYNRSKVAELKSGYYVWLIAYGLLVAAHYSDAASKLPIGFRNPRTKSTKAINLGVLALLNGQPSVMLGKYYS